MQIDINTQINGLFGLLMNVQPTKKTSLDTLNPLFAKINALVAFLNNSEGKSLPDATMKMLYDFLEDLKSVLQRINSEDNSFFGKLTSFLPGSTSQQLKALVPRLNEVYNKVVLHFSESTSTGSKSLTRERPIELEEEDFEEDAEEMAKRQTGYKKVKIALEETRTPQSNMIGEEPFYVRLVCSPEIGHCFPEENRLKAAKPFDFCGKSRITFHREDFRDLPMEMVMRLSKQHATVEAHVENNRIVYDLLDHSQNGTFLIGNFLDGVVHNPPQKLTKDHKYRLKHGDRFALLLTKGRAVPGLLLGFELVERRNY